MAIPSNDQQVLKINTFGLFVILEIKDKVKDHCTVGYISLHSVLCCILQIIQH